MVLPYRTGQFREGNFEILTLTENKFNRDLDNNNLENLVFQLLSSEQASCLAPQTEPTEKPLSSQPSNALNMRKLGHFAAFQSAGMRQNTPNPKPFSQANTPQ